MLNRELQCCGKCHWFRQPPGTDAKAGGYCFEQPPRVLLLPMQVQPSKVIAGAAQPQQGLALQSVYPFVTVDGGCTRFAARASDTH